MARVFSATYLIGTTLLAWQVAKIIESKNSRFPVGKRIAGILGWRTHTIVNMKNITGRNIMDQPPYLLPEEDMVGLPPSLAVGMLGMPGNMAYFGLLEICKPKANEVLVVTAAGGSVGSHVGQIGKIMGLKVIGITGSNKKCRWITEELGFDHAINYKRQNVAAELKKFAPEGVDCYFDNVGGEISSTVLSQMNTCGRVAACGYISAYNSDPSSLPKATIIQPAVIFNQLKIEGMVFSQWMHRWFEGIYQNAKWIKEGKLKYRETITYGFENMFHAFNGLLKGKNVGKAIVKV
ncbi:prostaglandin reductase 1 isoform X2 [Diachasma alloeum]|nr:prostaglandin reductase 1 isoform X2 [Diachasma alloeum]